MTEMKETKRVNPYEGKGWIKEGMYWGVGMFFIMGIGYPLYNSEPITIVSLLMSAGIWSLGGLAYGFTMKLFMSSSFIK